MISITVYRSGMIRRKWRLKIQADNGEKLPDDYDDRGHALETADLMFGVSEPVRVRTRWDDGAYTDWAPIR